MVRGAHEGGKGEHEGRGMGRHGRGRMAPLENILHLQERTALPSCRSIHTHCCACVHACMHVSPYPLLSYRLFVEGHWWTHCPEAGCPLRGGQGCILTGLHSLFLLHLHSKSDKKQKLLQTPTTEQARQRPPYLLLSCCSLLQRHGCTLALSGGGVYLEGRTGLGSSVQVGGGEQGGQGMVCIHTS